ncbi:MAG: phosphoribosylamine--glycine ligase [Coriobacteriia bacterium]|nr:phosphoribosylamine--glycine ligase [Coriobacteriia bacterium]
MDILVLGSGGREHAITASLAASRLVSKLYVAPGNGGTGQIAKNISLAIEDPAAVTQKAKELEVDLLVIGPEAPLVAGVADAARAAGIAVFGPSAAAARLEGSKRFAKGFMDRHGLPTAAWGGFQDLESALGFLATHHAPIVIKADGLAAGKGVTVAESDAEAAAAVEACFGGRFGAAGSEVVIEERLTGPECSCLAFTDGRRLLPMPLAQDHKRVGEGDTGPNTGGMGVYAPVPQISAQTEAAILAIMEGAVRGLQEEGLDYRGVLYGGFILTADGPKLLEFNARFGDPETQVLLPLLQSDLAELMYLVATQDTTGLELEWSCEAALSVVLASGGYPGSYQTDKPIAGVVAAEAIPGVKVYQAGTRLGQDGGLFTAGGRVLDVTALGPDLAEAQKLAYEALSYIDFEGIYYRRDIGARALGGQSG